MPKISHGMKGQILHSAYAQLMQSKYWSTDTSLSTERHFKMFSFPVWNLNIFRSKHGTGIWPITRYDGVIVTISDYSRDVTSVTDSHAIAVTRPFWGLRTRCMRCTWTLWDTKVAMTHFGFHRNIARQVTGNVSMKSIRMCICTRVTYACVVWIYSHAYMDRLLNGMSSRTVLLWDQASQIYIQTLSLFTC